MNEQAIVDRIISDAEEEARKIIEDAERKAAQTIAEANERAARNRAGTEAEVKAKAASIADGKAATARLDGAKILLGEKRGVIDEVYARALKGLNALKDTDAVYLAGKLLEEHAEEGDEIVFAENYAFVEEVSKLSVIKERHLKLSPKKQKLDGGFILVGKNSDKDISYGALLAEDRENNQAEIAVEIFSA